MGFGATVHQQTSAGSPWAGSWYCGRFRLDLSRPQIMGIVNVTPDSFSDGGRYAQCDAAVKHAKQLLNEGADLLDVGGESTRPGAAEVSVEEELARVIPVIERLRALPVPISIDTSKPAVMRAALDAGASIVNDVRALQEPGAMDVVREGDCGLVLMHMQGTPRTMQAAPQYADPVSDVARFLAERRDALMEAGVAAARIALDPGFGFGKTVEHNFTLLRRLGELHALGQPLLVGLSRKSMLGQATGQPVEQRVTASAVAALLAAQRGAQILRVHDVAATRDALRVWMALNN